MKYKIGVSTNCECGENIEETCKNIKQAGFQNILLSERKNSLENDIQTAQKLGLEISYVHLTNSFASDLWGIGVANDRYVKGVVDSIKICGKYGIKIAVMHPTVGDAMNLALPPNQHALNRMKEILKVAEENNVKIALENVDSINQKHLFFLLDNIDSPWLGFCYDCGHHYLYNPNVDLMKKYGNRCAAIHLHDNLMDWEYGRDFSWDHHYLPFDGKIDFDKVVKNIAKSQYDDVIMLELHRVPMRKPKLYEKVQPVDFLKEAHKRGEELAGMLENFREKTSYHNSKDSSKFKK